MTGITPARDMESMLLYLRVAGEAHQKDTSATAHAIARERRRRNDNKTPKLQVQVL
jgi:hypothetical protein